LNENEDYQYYLDYRTGCATAITGRFNSERLRAACSALNRARTVGIMEISQQTPPGESLQADVWAASFTRGASSWDVPLISLEKLGIDRDRDGFLTSNELEPLTSGAEAAPYFDAKHGVVYKLFDLRENGSLGKKVVVERDSDGEFQIELADATLFDTLKKLTILNDAGALVSEIVGLSDSGDYLISKQPYANPREDFHEDREVSIHAIRGIVPVGSTFRRTTAITYINGSAWLVDDLHDRNIMRTAEDKPTIIDALTGNIPPLAIKELDWLKNAIADAKYYRENNQIPLRKPFDDVADDDL